MCGAKKVKSVHNCKKKDILGEHPVKRAFMDDSEMFGQQNSDFLDHHLWCQRAPR